MTILVGYVPNAGGDKALGFAISLARAFGEDLLIANAGYHGAGEEDVDVKAQVEERIQPQLEESGVAFSFEHFTGFYAPSDHILELAHSNEAITMVVLGGRRRSLLGKMLMGSNAQRIIVQSNKPVITVNPD